MTRTAPALAALVLAVIVIASVPVAGAAQSTPEKSQANESVMAPGERLGGVVGVQGAELADDLERRSFGIEVAAAASGETRAAIVAEELDAVEARMEELEERKQALDRARAEGTISAGTHDARTAVVATQQSNLVNRLDAIETVAAALPPELLEREGIDRTRIRTIEEDASALFGPDVDATAGTLVGPDGATSIAGDPVPVTAVPWTEASPGGNQTAMDESPDAPSNDTGSTSTGIGDGDADGPLTDYLG